MYQNCYTPSPVCAPSRSSLITGMYPTTLGTQHMRAYKKTEVNTAINMHNLFLITALNQRSQFVFLLKTSGQMDIIVQTTLKRITICLPRH